MRETYWVTIETDKMIAISVSRSAPRIGTKIGWTTVKVEASDRAEARAAAKAAYLNRKTV